MKYCNAVPDPGYPVESLNVHYKNICITKLLDLVTFLVWLAVLANFLWRRFFCLLDPGPPYGSGSNISPILWTHVDPDPTFLPFCGSMWIRIQHFSHSVDPCGSESRAQMRSICTSIEQLNKIYCFYFDEQKILVFFTLAMVLSVEQLSNISETDKEEG